jgi:hypothetical protein
MCDTNPPNCARGIRADSEDAPRCRSAVRCGSTPHPDVRIIRRPDVAQCQKSGAGTMSRSVPRSLGCRRDQQRQGMTIQGVIDGTLEATNGHQSSPVGQSNLTMGSLLPRTVTCPRAKHYSYLRSRLVKEIAELGGFSARYLFSLSIESRI